MIGIYKITSPSGKIYIGQSIDIEKRWINYQYLKKAYTGPILLNSFLKYGWNNHIYEIIEECSLELLNERETYYKQHFINEFGWDKALFCELHDNGGGLKSNKTKINQSKGLKKAYDSGKRIAFYKGKKRSLDYKNKMKKANSKPIKCDTLHGMEFESAKEAAIILGICSKRISCFFRGICSHVDGLTFSLINK